MKNVVCIALFASCLASAQEHQPPKSPLAPHIEIPTLEYSLSIGTSTGLTTGALCALIEIATGESGIWILTWISTITLRRLVENSYFESFENENMTVKESLKIAQKKRISTIVGDLNAWLSYLLIKRALS